MQSANPDYGTLYNKGSGFFNINGQGGRKEGGGRERKEEREMEKTGGESIDLKGLNIHFN